MNAHALAWAFVHNLNALGSPDSSMSQIKRTKVHAFLCS